MTPTEILIAALWQKNRPKILAQLDLLAEIAATVPLADPHKSEAAGTAHKLAGSLGMYGYPAGTELARQLEEELGEPAPNAATLKNLLQQLQKVVA